MTSLCPTAPGTMAASTLCHDLLAGPRTRLDPAHRSREAWLLTAAGPTRWVCLSTPRAVLLPHALVMGVLPSVSAVVTVGDGALWYDDHPITVRRWLTPPRVTRGSLAGRATRSPHVTAWLAAWSERLGEGDGLTPYGDDVMCGAMLGLRATDDPRAGWMTAQVRVADLESRTTAVSAALLRSASDGWCIPEVASVVAALSTGRDAAEVLLRLLAVGHSSGRGIWAGLSSVLEPSATMVAA